MFMAITGYAYRKRLQYNCALLHHHDDTMHHLSPLNHMHAGHRPTSPIGTYCWQNSPNSSASGASTAQYCYMMVFWTVCLTGFKT